MKRNLRYILAGASCAALVFSLLILPVLDGSWAAEEERPRPIFSLIEDENCTYCEEQLSVICDGNCESEEGVRNNKECCDDGPMELCLYCE